MMRTIFRTCALIFPILAAPGTLWAACADAPAGLVSWWPGEGNGNDVLGRNPGTVLPGVTYGAGEVGQAFNFNSSTGGVFIAASASLDVGAGSGFTVECWIKP